MATKNVLTTVYICDVTGKEMTDPADVHNRTFEWGGVLYTLHLSDGPAGDFDEAAAAHAETGKAMQAFADVATRVKRTRKTSGSSAPAKPKKAGKSSDGPDPKAVRTWATATGWKDKNGMPIGPRGRVPADAVTDYLAAQG